MFQFLTQIFERAGQGVDQRGCNTFKPVPHFRVPGRVAEGSDESLRRPTERRKSLLELILAGPVLAGDTLIPGLQFVAHLCPPVAHLFPRVGSGLRIAFVRLHLLDGTYELFRAHFGAPPRRSPDGQEIGAVVGVIQSTLSLLREPDVTHVAVTTDHVIESYRNNLFDGYKTGEGVPPDLYAQFGLAEEALRSLGVVVWPMVEFEADDCMASAAHKWKSVAQVVILSPDKDMMQCVEGNRVVTFNRRDRKMFDAAGVVEKFGVEPGSIPDYLALVGDTADGVPGIPSWGAKSASTLLARYRSIEEIPPDPDTWDVTVRGAARLSENLERARSDAALYKVLTTLRIDVPIVESFEDLEWRGVRRTDYLALCDRLGLAELRSRPERWQ